MRRALALAVGLALAVPGVAAAQDPAPPAPTPTPTPPAPPPPAAGTLSAAATGTFSDRRALVALQGSAFRVTGALAPAVAGQRIEVRVLRKHRRVGLARATVAANGAFAVKLRVRRPGRVTIRVRHPGSPQVAEARARPVVVFVERARLAAGARGHLVRMFQRGLARLHYAVSRSGVFDAATGRAAMAFRKVNGMPRRYDADRRVIRKVLAGKGAFRPRHPHAGHHVEADLSRQVLALIARGQVVRTYHTSSGAPATPTVIGTFRVYLKTPGVNSLGMVHSSYFIRGYAIHGYVDVPAFNASHGCLRVPIPDARRIYDWLRIGDRVIVYP